MAHRIRIDLHVIASLIPQGAKVLDVGCNDGELLAYLVEEKGVDGRGMELRQEGVNACVQKGLSVVQGDADSDLADYPDAAFDCAILSQTLQATRAPDKVLAELVRIGKRAIVSFPNFGYWRVRLHLLWRGAMPVTKTIPYAWYNTPNIHFCTIRDFEQLCQQQGIHIVEVIPLTRKGRRVPWYRHIGISNVAAEQAVFLLEKSER